MKNLNDNTIHQLNQNEMKSKSNEYWEKQMPKNHIHYSGVAQLSRTCLRWYQSFGKNINPTVNVFVTCDRRNNARNIAPGLHSGK